MKLYTFFADDTNRVVYGTTVNGKTYFFFSGFTSAAEAKEAILSRFKGFERTWHETSLEGEWSEIE
jgi:hypothetical protein